ncbi:GNAT family N-acetyltransferase [Priestia megaterium]|uniref:GNAT family N-acetyltransferase n=1 Tax=Priestia megaterium TaxID=1404 RepID=UPI0021010F7F|nr:GNAT family protein [Priestia megaterium]
MDNMTLKVMTAEDIDSLYRIIIESLELWTNNLDDMRALVEEINEYFSKGRVFPYIVFNQITNQIIGKARLYEVSLEHGIIEMGSTVYPDSIQINSVDKECVFLLLKHAFQKLDMTQVQIKVDFQNKRAQKTIKHLGICRESVLINENILHNGQVRKTLVYCIVKEEWPLIKLKYKSKIII